MGLRERKKLITRKAILDAAREMFTERGYDNVTVAEIGDAVNLSAKTVFAYFSSKEDLVFADAEETLVRLRDRLRNRPAGQTPLAAVAEAIREEFVAEREELSGRGTRLADEVERSYRMIMDSPTLRSRMRLWWEQLEEAFAEVLASEAGPGPRPRVVAGQLVLIFRLLLSEHIVGYLREHEEPKQWAALGDWLDVCVELIGNGIGEYGRRGGA